MPVPLLVFSPRSLLGRGAPTLAFVFFANPTRSPRLPFSRALIFFPSFYPLYFYRRCPSRTVCQGCAFVLPPVTRPPSLPPADLPPRVTGGRVSRRRFKVPLSGCSARNVYSRCFRETQSRGGDFRRHCGGISACAYRMFTVDVGAECLRPRTRHVVALSGPEMPLVA